VLDFHGRCNPRADNFCFFKCVPTPVCDKTATVRDEWNVRGPRCESVCA
jgi:hypothetical protein